MPVPHWPWPDQPAPARRLASFGLIYALAAALLLWRFLSSDLHYDDALVGLMVQAFMEEDFHVFFYGQNYMGTLDALLAWPVFALFGSNTLALPPAMALYFAGEARTHYGLGLLLSALILWQTARLDEHPTWRGAALGGWGLLSGLAF